MKKLSTSIIIAFILISGSYRVVAQSTVPAGIRIDSLLQSLYEHDKAMASLTIRQDGKTVYSNATGFIENSGIAVKSEADTRYRIGSISKMFTTVMIMQLVEEGKLRLDTPLSDFFPKIPNSKSITITQLLNHHSGLLNFTNDESYANWMTEPRSRTQLCEIFENQKAGFAPGSKGEYSNTNFVLLGFIIEDVTGKPYTENLSERITGPIGLKNTKYGSKIGPDEAESFEFKDGKWVVLPETDMSIPGGAGAIISSTPDLTEFITALFCGKLLNDNSIKSMTNFTDGFGLGLFRFPFYERSAYGHNGNIDGFSSSLTYFPESKVAIAFCSNALNYSMNDILIGVLSCYFGKPYDIPDFKSVVLSAEKLKAYEGEYSSTQIPLIITVKQNGSVLSAQATGQAAFPLEAVSETEFRFDQAGIVMTFSITAGGEIDGFILKQGADYTFKRVVKP